MRVEAQQAVNNDVMRRRQEAIAHELDSIRIRQQQLETTNERLQDKAIDIRHSLNNDDLDLSDVQYQQLKLHANQDDFALKDFVAVCITTAFSFHMKFVQQSLSALC